MLTEEEIFDLIAAGTEHMRRGRDVDRLLSLLIFDNSIRNKKVLTSFDNDLEPLDKDSQARPNHPRDFRYAYHIAKSPKFSVDERERFVLHQMLAGFTVEEMRSR